MSSETFELPPPATLPAPPKRQAPKTAGEIRARYCNDINALLDATWEAHQRANGLKVHLVDADEAVAVFLRLLYVEHGWDCVAVKDGGLFGYPVEFFLLFKFYGGK